MSSKYEDLIKNARMNADCGEHMSPAEVTTLLNVVEATFSALAAENAGMKQIIDSVTDLNNEPQYHAEGMGCGLEDRGITDRYDACRYGWDEAMERIYGEVIPCAEEIAFPATDAFLAEVRASAVDEACLKISNAIVNCYQDEQIGLDAAATICGDFSSEIRKGVQS